MAAGNVFPTRTDPAVHFTEALAQNAVSAAHIPINSAISASPHCRAIIRHVVILSVQQLAWEVVFFGRRALHTAPIADNSFLSAYRFTAANGVQYAGGSGLYYYQAQNIDLPYADYDVEDATIQPVSDRGGKWHLLLVNRSPTAKIAGALGAVRVVGYMELTRG